MTYRLPVVLPPPSPAPLKPKYLDKLVVLIFRRSTLYVL